jgi:hypothetical protein
MIARMEDVRAKKSVKIYDHLGRPWKEEIPSVKSATWMRRVYYKGPARVGRFDSDGKEGDTIREELVRAQIPYVCTLLVYESKFQIEPTRREYFVYAPLEIQKAAELALRLWQRWERPPRPEFTFGDMREVFPKIEDGIVAEPLMDADFDEHWKDVRKRPHKAAGNPDDPFAFTCLDQDVKIYKHSDFQAGLITKIR